MPSIARMPASSYARAAASGKKYMSLQQVMPPRSISAAPSSVPSWTNSGATKRPSRGQMCCSSHAFSGTSSAMPRSSVIAACVCALTRPGNQHVLGQRDALARRVIAIGVGGLREGDDAPAVDDQRVIAAARPAGSTGTIQRASMRRSTVRACVHRAKCSGSKLTERRVSGVRRRARADLAKLENKKPRDVRGAFRETRARQRLRPPSPFTSTSTRRFGARHAISSFRAFWLQTTPGTGCVLPMPSVSIRSLGTPLLTR